MEMIRKGKWRMAVVDIDDSVCKDSKALRTHFLVFLCITITLALSLI
jgi:hypothetical protein